MSQNNVMINWSIVTRSHWLLMGFMSPF